MLAICIILAVVAAVGLWALCGNDNPYQLPRGR